MLCSKCYQEISHGREIQFKCSIICKKCALLADKITKKEIVNTCTDCREPIYKGDIVYKISYNTGITWLILSMSRSTEEILCLLCHEHKKWPISLKNIKKMLCEI